MSSLQDDILLIKESNEDKRPIILSMWLRPDEKKFWWPPSVKGASAFDIVVEKYVIERIPADEDTWFPYFYEKILYQSRRYFIQSNTYKLHFLDSQIIYSCYRTSWCCEGEKDLA